MYGEFSNSDPEKFENTHLPSCALESKDYRNFW